MRRILSLLLLLSLTPLLSLTSGCSLNEKYVDADRSTHDYISSKFRKVLAKDLLRVDKVYKCKKCGQKLEVPGGRVFDDDTHEDIDLFLDTWDFRVRRAERFLEIDRTPPDPIWGK